MTCSLCQLLKIRTLLHHTKLQAPESETYSTAHFYHQG
uniref:Uncharacterized protein n=1 Tax=Anguilla anguilla TaxID=7936 RepID=A0A0E9QPL7_ANGAN